MVLSLFFDLYRAMRGPRIKAVYIVVQSSNRMTKRRITAYAFENLSKLLVLSLDSDRCIRQISMMSKASSRLNLMFELESFSFEVFLRR